MRGPTSCIARSWARAGRGAARGGERRRDARSRNPTVCPAAGWDEPLRQPAHNRARVPRHVCDNRSARGRSAARFGGRRRAAPAPRRRRAFCGVRRGAAWVRRADVSVAQRLGGPGRRAHGARRAVVRGDASVAGALTAAGRPPRVTGLACGLLAVSAGPARAGSRFPCLSPERNGPGTRRRRAPRIRPCGARGARPLLQDHDRADTDGWDVRFHGRSAPVHRGRARRPTRRALAPGRARAAPGCARPWRRTRTPGQPRGVASTCGGFGLAPETPVS